MKALVVILLFAVPLVDVVVNGDHEVSRQLQSCGFDDVVASRCEFQAFIDTLIFTDLLPGGTIQGGGDVNSSWFLYWNYTGRERCFEDANDSGEGEPYSEDTFDETTGYCETSELTETYGGDGALQTYETIFRITRPISRQGIIRQVHTATTCDSRPPDLKRGSSSFCFEPCAAKFAINNRECLPGCFACRDGQSPAALNCSNIDPDLVEDCDRSFFSTILTYLEGLERTPAPTPALVEPVQPTAAPARPTSSTLYLAPCWNWWTLIVSMIGGVAL